MALTSSPSKEKELVGRTELREIGNNYGWFQRIKGPVGLDDVLSARYKTVDKT